MATIAPWIVPPDYLGAIRSGAGLGLQLRQQSDAEAQAAERLRLANEELIYKAQQDQVANQLRANQAMAENQIRQQQLAQQAAAQQAENELKYSQLGQQAEAQSFAQQLKQAEENRAANLFNQQAQFAELARNQVLPGGGDFESLTPDEQNQMLAKAKRQNFEELLRNAPQDVLPSLLSKEITAGYQGNMSRGLMTYYAQLGAKTGETILDPTSPDGIDRAALERATQKMGGEGGIVRRGQMTVNEKQAEDYANQVKEQNPNISDQELQLEKQRYIASKGDAAKIPTDTLKKIEAGDTIIQGLNTALDNVEKFNAKFGPNAFDQFTGPIEGRIQKLKSKYGNLSKEDEIAARQIWSSIAQIEQAYRQANFGTALTANELNQFKNIVEDPTSTAFIPTLRSFKDTSERVLRNQISLRPYASNLPSVLRERYFQPSNAPSGSSVGKYRIISVGQ